MAAAVGGGFTFGALPRHAHATTASTTRRCSSSSSSSSSISSSANQANKRQRRSGNPPPPANVQTIVAALQSALSHDQRRAALQSARSAFDRHDHHASYYDEAIGTYGAVEVLCLKLGFALAFDTPATAGAPAAAIAPSSSSTPATATTTTTSMSTATETTSMTAPGWHARHLLSTASGPGGRGSAVSMARSGTSSRAPPGASAAAWAPPSATGTTSAAANAGATMARTTVTASAFLTPTTSTAIGTRQPQQDCYDEVHEVLSLLHMLYQRCSSSVLHISCRKVGETVVDLVMRILVASLQGPMMASPIPSLIPRPSHHRHHQVYTHRVNNNQVRNNNNNNNNAVAPAISTATAARQRQCMSLLRALSTRGDEHTVQSLVNRPHLIALFVQTIMDGIEDAIVRARRTAAGVVAAQQRAMQQREQRDTMPQEQNGRRRQRQEQEEPQHEPLPRRRHSAAFAPRAAIATATGATRATAASAFTTPQQHQQQGQEEDFDTVLWPRLIAQGWTVTSPYGVKNKRYYFPPGVTMDNGRRRKDYFDSKSQVRRYVLATSSASLASPASTPSTSPPAAPAASAATELDQAQQDAVGEDRQKKKQQGILLDLLNNLRATIDRYDIFAQPVDPIRDECPDYYTKIDRNTEAMDLSTMEVLIRNGTIASVNDVEKYLNRIVKAAKKYNTDRDHFVRKEADLVRSRSQPLLTKARQQLRRLELESATVRLSGPQATEVVGGDERMGNATETNDDEDDAVSPHHKLITIPQYAGQWTGTSWTQVLTKHSKRRCKSCQKNHPARRPRTTRTYCICDIQRNALCVNCFPGHVAEAEAKAKHEEEAVAATTSEKDSPARDDGGQQEEMVMCEEDESESQFAPGRRGSTAAMETVTARSATAPDANRGGSPLGSGEGSGSRVPWHDALAILSGMATNCTSETKYNFILNQPRLLSCLGRVLLLPERLHSIIMTTTRRRTNVSFASFPSAIARLLAEAASAKAMAQAAVGAFFSPPLPSTTVSAGTVATIADGTTAPASPRRPTAAPAVETETPATPTYPPPNMHDMNPSPSRSISPIELSLQKQIWNVLSTFLKKSSSPSLSSYTTASAAAAPPPSQGDVSSEDGGGNGHSSNGRGAAPMEGLSCYYCDLDNEEEDDDDGDALLSLAVFNAAILSPLRHYRQQNQQDRDQQGINPTVHPQPLPHPLWALLLADNDGECIRLQIQHALASRLKGAVRSLARALDLRHNRRRSGVLRSAIVVLGAVEHWSTLLSTTAAAVAMAGQPHGQQGSSQHILLNFVEDLFALLGSLLSFSSSSSCCDGDDNEEEERRNNDEASSSKIAYDGGRRGDDDDKEERLSLLLRSNRTTSDDASDNGGFGNDGAPADGAEERTGPSTSTMELQSSGVAHDAANTSLHDAAMEKVLRMLEVATTPQLPVGSIVVANLFESPDDNDDLSNCGRRTTLNENELTLLVKVVRGMHPPAAVRASALGVLANVSHTTNVDVRVQIARHPHLLNSFVTAVGDCCCSSSSVNDDAAAANHRRRPDGDCERQRGINETVVERRMKEHIAVALQNLSAVDDEASLSLSSRKRLIELLISLLDRGNTVKTRQCAAGAIQNLAFHSEENGHQMIKHGGHLRLLFALGTMIRSETDAKSKERSIVALRNLACNDDVAEIMARSDDVVLALSEGASGLNRLVGEHASATLRKLLPMMSDSGFRQVMMHVASLMPPSSTPPVKHDLIMPYQR